MANDIIKIENLRRDFKVGSETVHALRGISFSIRAGEFVTIMGTSGSGKSTLAKMLAGMVEPTAGEVLIDDHPLTFGDYSFRSQRIRMIFQDPSTSLNPRQRISQILDFPLRLNTDLEPDARRKRVFETLRMVGQRQALGHPFFQSMIASALP